MLEWHLFVFIFLLKFLYIQEFLANLKVKVKLKSSLHPCSAAQDRTKSDTVIFPTMLDSLAYFKGHFSDLSRLDLVPPIFFSFKLSKKVSL